MGHPNPILYAKLVERCTPVESGCWEWQRGRSQHGYSVFKWQGFTTSAHRWMHIAAIGPIPDGYEVHHLCRNPPCINPAHLEAVTVSQNRILRERWFINGDTCQAGHAYTDENTYHMKNGTRKCRACRNRLVAEHRARREAENLVCENCSEPAGAYHRSKAGLIECHTCYEYRRTHNGTPRPTTLTSKDHSRRYDAFNRKVAIPTIQ